MYNESTQTPSFPLELFVSLSTFTVLFVGHESEVDVDKDMDKSSALSRLSTHTFTPNSPLYGWNDVSTLPKFGDSGFGV